MQVTPIDKSHFELLKEALAKKGKWPVRIISGSMEPLIMTGEELEVLPVEDTDSLKRFDVLVFWNGENLFCHYLWSRNKYSQNGEKPLLVTRGLNAKGEDFPIKPEAILGIVPKRISWWRKLLVILKN